MDIYKEFLNSAKKQPDKIALIHKDKKVKFSQAAKDVNRLAYAFKEMGMKKGEKLAVFLPNSIEYVYTYLSALGLGITVVPIDISFKPEELKNILSHAEVSYLVAEKALKFNFPYKRKNQNYGKRRKKSRSQVFKIGESTAFLILVTCNASFLIFHSHHELLQFFYILVKDAVIHLMHYDNFWVKCTVRNSYRLS